MVEKPNIEVRKFARRFMKGISKIDPDKAYRQGIYGLLFTLRSTSRSLEALTNDGKPKVYSPRGLAWIDQPVNGGATLGTFIEFDNLGNGRITEFQVVPINQNGMTMYKREPIDPQNTSRMASDSDIPVIKGHFEKWLAAYSEPQ